jgi:hypothetical protein
MSNGSNGRGFKNPTIYNVQWCDLGGIQRLYMGEYMKPEEFFSVIRNIRSILGTPIPRSEKMQQFDKEMENRELYKVSPRTYHVWPMLEDEV